MKKHPYLNIKSYQRWGATYKSFDYSEINFHVSPKFQLTKNLKISTAGSCFAQHISQHLSKLGIKTYKAELPPTFLKSDHAELATFDIYSARYGNIYTTKQLRDLIDQSIGIRPQINDIHQNDDGSFTDMLRPSFTTIKYTKHSDLIELRSHHLSCVKEIIYKSDVFIYTLGLTEAWENSKEDYVYPVCPGTAGGNYDDSLHKYVNYEFEDVQSDLKYSIEKLRECNPKIKIILTVSPIPLAATFENKNVAVSTCLSKSVLRSVAEWAKNKYDFVDYFPSYDILTSPAAGGRYFDFTFRQVNAMGVDLAMNEFIRTMVDVDDYRFGDTNFIDENVQCEEQLYEQLLREKK
jgi:hypothetical protein